MKGKAPRALLRPEDLKKLGHLNLIARWAVEGFISGLHKSPYHGFSVEFAEYREYTPGDDLRHFDWKVFGRSDRPYIKRYQSETNLKVHVLLDASASMGYGSGELTKFHYARCLAAALVFLMIRQQDAVGLAMFADDILDYRVPRSSPQHRRELLDVLANATVATTTDIARTLHHLAEFIKGRGLIVLISDLFDDEDAVVRGLRHFRFKRHDVIVLHVFDPAELAFPFHDLADFLDPETGERMQVYPPAIREMYRRQVEGFIEGYRAACSNGKIDYQVVETTEPFDTFLARYLHKRSRLG